MDGDAYATSTALVALGKAGLDAKKSEAYQKGVRYLLRTQRADGAWVVQTRSASSTTATPAARTSS